MTTQGAPVFIGYRRRDSQGFAGRVADDLIDHFGVHQIFRDDDIPEGSDFTRVLEQALGSCHVLIAVIGPDWLNPVKGIPRIHHPDDWVRREIEAALSRGIWTLPILVGNATMPSAEELPDTLLPFSKVQAVTMSDRHWDRDLERLAVLLKKRIPSLHAIKHYPEERSQASPHDALGKIAEVIFRQQTEKRRRDSSAVRILGRLMVRALWLGVLLLLGWYLFENHATPEVRQFVFDFLAFAQNKITGLLKMFQSA
ncbi:MAG: toll/interleukin-1 receptor domain-containing protein [Granulosicoccus sp.]